jgi:N-acetylmuramoyl-L-alanine amidase
LSSKPVYARDVRSSSTQALAALVIATLVLVLAGAGCGKLGSGGAQAKPRQSTATATAVTVSAPAAASSARAVAPPSASSTGEQASVAPPAARTPATTATRAAGSGTAAPVRPTIVQSPIPFGAKRKVETAAYALRHYGIDSYRLIEPHVIVIHYTETPDFQSTYNTFAPDVPDSELHELPNTCAHFVVDADGTIHQLVPLGIMCRHTVGLNWTAIGVEHVGYSDAEVLDRPKQMRASLRLVRWLRCRYSIPVESVIGHNESLASPYHHENVPSLRTQTHSDFDHADMQVYRARLRAAGAC